MITVPLLNPKFALEVPGVRANFGFAALAPGRRNVFRKHLHA
jgi:hypothetical protein